MLTMFIFSSKKVNLMLMDNFSPGSFAVMRVDSKRQLHYLVQEIHWIFLSLIPLSFEKPMLLFFDGFSYKKNVLNKNFIHEKTSSSFVLFSALHISIAATWRIIYVSFDNILWTRGVWKWLINLTIYQIAKLYRDFFQEQQKSNANTIKDLEKSGIYPYRDVFPDHIYTLSEIIEIPSRKLKIIRSTLWESRNDEAQLSTSAFAIFASALTSPQEEKRFQEKKTRKEEELLSWLLRKAVGNKSGHKKKNKNKIDRFFLERLLKL